MKKLLLITGDLATGKSTFAAILSARYNCPALCKDKIKEILADTVGFTNREENLRLSRATMEIMIHCFSRMALSGGDIILEANFRQTEMDSLSKIAEENGYEMLTLQLRADVDILYARFINRIENENRHPAHISGFDSYEGFCSYILKARDEKPTGQVIDICADDFSYQTDGDIIREIDRFWG